MTGLLLATELERFRREGYCVIDGALASETVGVLREEAELAVAWQAAEIRANRGGVENISRLDHRYFIPRRSVERPRLRELILSEAMATLLAPLLGPDAFLFIDVFVHKAAKSDNDFRWHQDHGYVAHYGFGQFAPSVTVWTPLDEVDEANGALYVLPFSPGRAPSLVPHDVDPASSDCVAAVNEPGICIPMRPGSLLVMSGLLLHRSGPNTTDRPRTAYQWQYSPAPILDGDRPISLASPFLADGRWVSRAVAR